MRAQGIIIPAYKPDERLPELVSGLLGADFSPVVVVDDGSGDGFAHVFEQARLAGATVLRHDVNLGKGAALKTAIRHFLEAVPGAGAITADADSQHAICDIIKVADALDAHPGALVLGVRTLGHMPLKNRFGNALTCLLFAAIAGFRVSDTQTGLRALPSSGLAKLAELPGERYEYEMNMLLAVKPLGIPVAQVPIQTIYEPGNRSSHFRPLRDGMRIYRQLFSWIFTRKPR